MSNPFNDILDDISYLRDRGALLPNDVVKLVNTTHSLKEQYTAAVRRAAAEQPRVGEKWVARGNKEREVFVRDVGEQRVEYGDSRGTTTITLGQFMAIYRPMTRRKKNLDG